MSFVISFVLGMILTGLVLVFTRSFGFVNKPSADRWSTKTVSLHGGIAIWIAWIAALFLIKGPEFDSREALLVCLPSIMMLVGLVDDIFTLMPRAKLSFQLGVALVVCFFGMGFQFLPYEPLNWLLTMFWMIGIGNAINLLDNMDGASPGIAFIIALSLSLLPWEPAPWLGLMSMSLAGTLAGFLIFNFHPAKIYMGDSGSLFLGCALSMMLMEFSQTISPQITHTSLMLPSAFLIPVLMAAVPIIDTTYVTINRLLNGYPVSQGDRGHITHRLSYMFQSDWLSVLTLYLYQLLICSIVASYHWKLFYPVGLATLYLLYKLTKKTNGFVWPARFNPSAESLTSHRYLFLKRHSFLHWLFKVNQPKD